MLGSPPLARRGLQRFERLALVAVVAAVALLAFAGVASAAPRTLYVDCTAGNDASAGTGTGNLAWRTLTRANSATLVAGDKLLLRRGCAWTGPLTAKWSGTAGNPITIDAYGTGNPPVIQNAHDNVMITGSYLLLQNLSTRADPPFRDAACGNAPAGWRVGFRFYSGAAYNTLRWTAATGLYNGIRVDQGAHHEKILGNHLINNNMKDEHTNSDAGIVGILLMGDDNEVANNNIIGSDQCSPLYKRDGSAVEVYGGQRNVVHHNTASENNAFMELGNSRSSDTTVAYNKVYSTLKIANFLVTRGAGDTKWGPVLRTRAYNNSVRLTGAESYAIECLEGCSASVLSLRNNIVVSQYLIGYASAAFDEGNNIFWQPQGAPKIYFPISSTTRKVDPRWVGSQADDFRLAAGSPAIDTGSMVAYNLGFRSDLTGLAVPRAAAPDIGAYER
jgi:hypothetical protein